MVYGDRYRGQPRKGWSLRIALGFAAFGVGAALALAPAAEEAVYKIALTLRGGGTDDFTTAGIRRPDAARTTGERRALRTSIRRSVLHPEGKTCILYSDGTSEGC